MSWLVDVRAGGSISTPTPTIAKLLRDHLASFVLLDLVTLPGYEISKISMIVSRHALMVGGDVRRAEIGSLA